MVNGGDCSEQTTSVDAAPGQADALEHAQLTVALGATADQAVPGSDVQQATAPNATPAPPDSDSEGSQHGPYVVGDYFMGFEFQIQTRHPQERHGHLDDAKGSTDSSHSTRAESFEPHS